MWANLPEDQKALARNALHSNTLLGRIADQIAGAVIHLASDASRSAAGTRKRRPLQVLSMAHA
jgi:hypothetical protein